MRWFNPFVTSGTYIPLTKSPFKSTGITVSHFFSMLPSTLKYLYSINQSECIFPRNSHVQMILCAMLHSSIAHSIICTVRLFRGKMHSDWFKGIEILQGIWQHGEKVGHCYPSGLEKTLCKWDIYVPLIAYGLKCKSKHNISGDFLVDPNCVSLSPFARALRTIVTQQIFCFNFYFKHRTGDTVQSVNDPKKRW